MTISSGAEIDSGPRPPSLNRGSQPWAWTRLLIPARRARRGVAHRGPPLRNERPDSGGPVD